MKTLTNLLENFESNPGNDVKLGVTNHLTPLNNIITNIRNLFASEFGLVIEPGEDGVSLKIHSSKFVSVEEINKVLDTPYLGQTTLRSYICAQGLCNVKILDLGMYKIAYFGPNDIRTAENPEKVDKKKEKECKCGKPECPICNPNGLVVACKEMLQYNIDEAELEFGILTESGIDDEELEDKTKEQIIKFISGTDKVKCAEKLAELLKNDLDLPEDYYFKGVKDADGNESIALRYKFDKRRPFGKTVQLSKSLLNIYSTGEEAVWVEAFLYRDHNSDQMNNIVDTVLKLIGAQPTNDPCIWTITADDVKQAGDANTQTPEPKADDPKKDDENLNKVEGDQITGTLTADNNAQ